MKTTITTIKHNQWKPHNYEQIQKANSKKHQFKPEILDNWVELFLYGWFYLSKWCFCSLSLLATWFDKYIKASWESAHFPKGCSQDLGVSSIYSICWNIWSGRNIWFAQRIWIAWFRFFHVFCLRERKELFYLQNPSFTAEDNFLVWLTDQEKTSLGCNFNDVI